MDRTIVVQSAKRADIAQLSRTLARAFHTDPVMTWLWSRDDKRAHGLVRFFRAMTRHHHLAAGGVDIAYNGAGAMAGAALWNRPGRWEHSRFSELLMLPTLISGFGTRMRTGKAVGDTLARSHPTEPHWYLAAIGSDPRMRGAGYGRALMQHRLDHCDAEHHPAYLESSHPDNVPYYERFGFEVTNRIELANGGPTLWAMWRPPR
ncbi:GNAT family N-acetyltransferase [Nocardia sp. GCM10030253]|uniref:GNAT family N-acetyltransferase n=1 Tax=Nocardia sp. GCM10030253 TaxID=3273404 RepID=UPI003632354C